MSALKKYQFTILGLVSGSLVEIVDSFAYKFLILKLHLPPQKASDITAFLRALSIFPWKPGIENWYQIYLPATALFWGLMGFAIDRLTLAGKRQAVKILIIALFAKIILTIFADWFLGIDF